MTQTLDADTVTEFGSAVRRQLSDLGPDTLDELTDGLEADLAEKLADGDELGDPAAYAAELRAAAGFAPTVGRTVQWFAGARASLDGLRSRIAALASHRALAPILDLVFALRPLWWVARAWALFFGLTAGKAIPDNEWDWPLLAALLVLSIQWGRARWLPWRWSRGGVVALSVIALLLVPSVGTLLQQRVTFADTMNPWDYVPDGILLDKRPVTNIFAYGPDGELITGVQLFDQNGDPLSVVSPLWPSSYFDDGVTDGLVYVPSSAAAGAAGWNVYPLQTVEYDDVSDDGYTVPTWAQRSDVSPPFRSVQPLVAE